MFNKKLIIGIIIILVLLLVILAAVRKGPRPEEEVPATQREITEPEAAEPEIISNVPPPLATGKQVYEIITDNSAKFKITEVEVDPFDVKRGESQRVRVLVKDEKDKPITAETKVEGRVYTDNKETPFSFALRQVSDANGSTLTEWEGFWILEDTYDRIYMIRITAKAADEEHKVELTLR